MLFGLAFIVFGIIGVVATLMAGTKTSQLKAKGIRAEGRIVRVLYRRVIDTDRYFPIIQFTTASGQTVEFEGTYFSTPDAVGQRVSVYYLPGNPQKAEALEGMQAASGKELVSGAFWSAVLIMIGVGLVALKLWARQSH